MPRISVVVPVYDVESYLATCLQSLARQTAGDLEVVMVDDGSTDGSLAIAERFVRRDRRFRLLTQANGGLGKARNTGLDAARGELVAFVDSDDVVPHDAYERLLGALDRTGSDFASGNVQRLTRQGAAQAQFLARTFARTRLKTHVTRFRPLLADRTAWNKLWRRSFWEEHGLRFPEGVVHEDIPVVLPAHALARSVDVIAAPVYQWRLREDGAPSITQRRLEPRVLCDRLDAIERVRDHFARHGSRKLRRWYDASLVADDLRLHLNLLDEADERYRELFVERVNALLAGAPDRIFSSLPAIDRLKWHLVRRGLIAELVEVLRFQREEAAVRAPLHARGRFYGDYPFRGDRRLGVPRATYRLGRRDEDLALTVHLEAVWRDGEKLRLRGHAYVNGLGAPSPASQRTTLAAVRPGRWRALRMRAAPLRLPTAPRRVAHGAAQRGPDLSWSGFHASLHPDDLRAGGKWEEATWQLFADTRTGLVRRRRARFVLASPELVGAVDLPAAGGACVRAAVTAEGAVAVEVRTAWARLHSRRRVDGDVLELRGDVRLPHGARHATLQLRRRSDARACTYPVHVAAGGTSFHAHAPLPDLRLAPPSLEAAAAGDASAPEMWELWLLAGSHRLAVGLPEELAGAAWWSGAHEVELIRTRRGDAALVARERRALAAARTEEERAPALVVTDGGS